MPESVVEERPDLIIGVRDSRANGKAVGNSNILIRVGNS
jgi:hypothetical protein